MSSSGRSHTKSLPPTTHVRQPRETPSLVSGRGERELGVFFTTPHFDGSSAILVVLDRITPEDLRETVVEAWLCRAPERVVAAYLDDAS